MTNDRHEPVTSLPPRRRLAAGTLLLCAALFLGAIPAATAQTDNQPATSESAANITPEVAGGGEAESAATTKAGKRTKRAAAEAPAASTSTPAVAPAATSTTPAAHTKGEAKARKQAAKEAAAARKAGTAQGGGAGETPAPAISKKAEKNKAKQTKTKEKKREEREERAQAREQRLIEKGKLPPKTAKPPVTGEPVAVPASTTADASSVGASGVLPTVASAGTTPPAIESKGATPVQDPPGAAAAHRRHDRPSPRSAAGAGISSGVALPLAALALTSARSPRPSASHNGSTPARASAPQSPIVTTITRIVNVVPLAARLLIAALLALALALAVRTGFMAMRARRLVRQREQLLEDVGLLQAALLPAPPARLGPVGTSVAYRPAAGPGAGGDFYDVFALEDGQLAVIVGDISGHGRQALPHTALVRFTLRAYLEAGLSPRDAVQTAGAVLEHQLGGSFATVVAATYNPRRRVLVYACAGHPRPLVLTPGSTPVAATTVCSAPPIGVGMRTGVRQTVVSIPGASQACFFTDGVTEARVGSELFGPERLADALAELGPEATAATVLDRVAAQTDRRPDDMAACMLNIEGGAEEPKVIREELELDLEEVTSDRPEHLLLAYGIAPEEIARFMSSARSEVAQYGSATLELSFSEGRAQPSLRRDNVAVLHAPAATRRRRLRMSL